MISSSKLDHEGFVFFVECGLSIIFVNNILVGNGFTCDGLYKSNIDLVMTIALHLTY